jgi:GT2 family glycosyltransferase
LLVKPSKRYFEYFFHTIIKPRVHFTNNKLKNLAVLLTCHNRRDSTHKALRFLYKAEMPKDILFDIYLVDDGSSDGTSEMIRNEFPDVVLIQGSGDLYWNLGMKLAWETSSNAKEYDFFLMLNDDADLDDNALLHLFGCFSETKDETGEESLIIGACRKNKADNTFSYGGRSDIGPIIPDGTLQKCKYINCNVVLVSKAIFEKIGGLSEHYIHRFGDVEYGLRAQRNGIECYVTKNYIASCEPNFVEWRNSEVSFTKRWAALHSLTGFSLKEYVTFYKDYGEESLAKAIFKIYLKTIFPKAHKKIKRFK